MTTATISDVTEYQLAAGGKAEVLRQQLPGHPAEVLFGLADNGDAVDGLPDACRGGHPSRAAGQAGGRLTHTQRRRPESSSGGRRCHAGRTGRTCYHRAAALPVAASGRQSPSKPGPGAKTGHQADPTGEETG